MTQQETLSNRGLIGYAVLRANFNSSAPSYIDNFGDYVLDALARNDPAELGESEVAKEVREHFGFTIPDRVVGRLLSKAVTKKVVDRINPPKGTKGHDHVVRYRLAAGQLKKIRDLRAEIEQFERQARDLARKFTDYVAQEFPEHLHLVDEEPTEHLGNYVENHAIPLLSEAMGRRPTGGVTQGDGISGPDYLVNAFLKHIGDTDAASFKYVVELVKGAILAAVVDLGTGELTRRLTGVHAVLDTPVLLKALGFQGDEQQLAVQQTLDLAKRHGVHIHCFEHTMNELEGVLLSVVPVLKSRGASAGTLRAVDSHFLDQGLTPADVALEVRKLPDRVRALGVSELPPPGNHFEFGLDEAALEDLLQKHIGYRSDGTRLYDVTSLSSIHRLRGGTCGNDFERCKYVLITDNDRLAYASKRVDERHGWPLAMMDADLAALLWVRSPGVNDDLPRTQLLATVYSGMQPGSHLWAKYLEGIEHLRQRGEVTDEDAILMRAPEGRAALMAETLGDENIDAETALAVLQRVQGELREPYQQEARRAEESRDAAVAVAERAAADRAAVEQERDQLRTEAARLSSAVEEFQADRAKRESDDKKRDERLRTEAEKTAHRIVKVTVIIFAVACIALFCVNQFAPAAVSALPSVVPLLALVGGILVVAIGALRHFIGGSVVDWLRPLEARLARWLERRKRRRAGLAENPPASPSE